MTSYKLKLKHNNDACGKLGGKAELQCFQAAAGVSDSDDSDSSNSDSPPRKKKTQKTPSKQREAYDNSDMHSFDVLSSQTY